MKKSLWIGGGLAGLIAVLLFVDTAFGQQGVVRRLQDLFDVERGVTPSEGEAPVWSSAQQQFVWGAPSAADTNAIANADGFGTNTTLRGTATIDGLLQILNNNAGIGRVWTDTNGSGIGHWADSAGGGGDLLAANNLSDVDDAGASRTNLVTHDASNLTIGTIDNDLLSDIPASAIASASKSGNGTVLGTVTGTLTQNKQLAFDANGNVIATSTDIGGAGGSPGGADTMLQFNESGSFSGTTNFTYDDVNSRIVVSPGGAMELVGGGSRITFNTTGDVPRYEIVGDDSDGSLNLNALDGTGSFAFQTLKLDSSGNAIFSSAQSTEFNIGSSSASVSTNDTGVLIFTDPTSGEVPLNEIVILTDIADMVEFADIDSQAELDALDIVTKTGAQYIADKKLFERTDGVVHDLGNVSGATSVAWSTNIVQMTLTANTAITITGDAPTSGDEGRMRFRVLQNGTGNFTLTVGGSAVAVDPVENSQTVVSVLSYDGGSSLTIYSDYLDLNPTFGTVTQTNSVRPFAVLSPASAETNYTITSSISRQFLRSADTNVHFTLGTISAGQEWTVFVDATTNSVETVVSFADDVIRNTNAVLTIPAGQLVPFTFYAQDAEPTNTVVAVGGLFARE